MNRNLWPLVGVLALPLLGMGAQAGDLTVTVEGVQTGRGPVLIALFDTPAGFPAGIAKAQQAVEAKQGTVEVVFKGLAPGSYAVSAFQDNNKNQRLDINMMGMPTEPYGFSRNARGHAGPPKFDKAVLTVDAKPQTISFRLE